MSSLRLLYLIISLVLSSLLFRPVTVAAAEKMVVKGQVVKFDGDKEIENGEVMTMTGRVVEFGGDKGIENVRVTVRYSKNNVDLILADKTTEGPEGRYEFEVPTSVSRVWIIYTPPKNSDIKYIPDGRAEVSNNANPKDLDTVGLVPEEEASKDEAAARNAALSLARYVSAKGNQEVAQDFVNALRKEPYSIFDEALVEAPDIIDSMESAGLKMERMM